MKVGGGGKGVNLIKVFVCLLVLCSYLVYRSVLRKGGRGVGEVIL